MTILSLIRHAPTEWNARGRIQGRSDIPLSDHGVTVASSWHLTPSIREARWVSSSLQRTRQTARILGVKPAIDDRLIEMDWGQWEGKTLAALRAALGQSMASNEDRGLDFTPPGGESPGMVQQRLRPWLKEIGRTGTPVSVITHKGVIRALTALATGWDMRGKDRHKIMGGTCRQFTVSRDGTPRLHEPDTRLAGA